MAAVSSTRGTNSTRILPPTDVLLALKNQGFEYPEIGARFGVTGNAVYKSLYRSGKTAGRKRYAADIPWAILAEHDNHVPLPNLRVKARRDAGFPISRDEERRLEGFLDLLRENDWVVGYDANLPADDATNRYGSYGGGGGFFVMKRHRKDPEWPSIITLRDMNGVFRRFEDLHPDNRNYSGHGV